MLTLPQRYADNCERSEKLKNIFGSNNTKLYTEDFGIKNINFIEISVFYFNPQEIKIRFNSKVLTCVYKNSVVVLLEINLVLQTLPSLRGKEDLMRFSQWAEAQ